MTNINFFLLETTHLRYFVPLIIEGNKRGIKSSVFVGRTGKYSNPYSNIEYINYTAEKYNFDIYPAEQIKNISGIVFCAEGNFLTRYPELVNDNQKIYAISTMIDFVTHHKKYIDKKQLVGSILPSEYFATRYGVEHDKNLYLGSPKYDAVLDEESILHKYELSKGKKVLVVAPRLRDYGKLSLSNIYDILKENGYEIIVKTRGKDPMPLNARGDRYFEDVSWFPHTSIELMKVCDFVINFTSTCIKECVMTRTPLINFHIKPFDKPMEFLYNYDYCENYDDCSNITKEQLQKSITRIATGSFEEEFDKAIEKYLFNFNSSQRILDYVLKND